jgi:hypothetical protein
MNNSGVKVKRLKDPIVFVRLEKLIEYSHLQSQKYEFLIKNIELFELKDNRIGRINKVKGIERLIKRILDNSTLLLKLFLAVVFLEQWVKVFL